jgi:predicted MFS family arabinose efflux permease
MRETASRSVGYQITLTALLSLNFGIVLFDRNALSFLMPFIQPDLKLNNTQVGVLASALSLTWAFAAFGIGVSSDRFGSRKQLLVLTTLAFSLCSFGSGLAVSFMTMLWARLLMGAAEGGIMPISQALIASEVSPRHRGLAMGVAQGFGSSLLGSFVAPVALVAFATAFGWRHAFFLAGAPGLVVALLMALVIRAPVTAAGGAGGAGRATPGAAAAASGASEGAREPAVGASVAGQAARGPASVANGASSAARGPAAGGATAREPFASTSSAPAEQRSLNSVLSDPNIIRCAILGILLVSYLVICWTFMPLYLTQVRAYDATTMGWLMGTLGISATIASSAIPALSDRIVRRPVTIAMPLIAIILPLAALYYGGSVWVLAAIFFCGWAVTGIFPLFMATIPSESVDARHMATALGICMGAGEVIGGVLSPSLAGVLADLVGLQAPLWMMFGLAVAAGIVALGLRETAPRVLTSATHPTHP